MTSSHFSKVYLVYMLLKLLKNQWRAQLTFDNPMGAYPSFQKLQENSSIFLNHLVKWHKNPQKNLAHRKRNQPTEVLAAFENSNEIQKLFEDEMKSEY